MTALHHTTTTTTASRSSHHHHHIYHHRRRRLPPPPGVTFLFWVLLSVVSLGDVAGGQHLPRVPPALVIITNPGERGLIPAQPFSPTHSAAATTTPAAIPVSPLPSEHARAHLNEVESGVFVQDHANRKAPPGANQPLPRLVLAALLQLAADDQHLTSKGPTGVKDEPRLTTNPPPPSLRDKQTPFFVPSPPDPHPTTPQFPPARGTPLSRQPHTATEPQLDPLRQLLPPDQPYSQEEHLQPASKVRGGASLIPTQLATVHQHQGQHTPVALAGEGAALPHRASPRQRVQTLLDQPAASPFASFAPFRPSHALVSTPQPLNTPHLLDATALPTKQRGTPLPTHTPAPTPSPLQPPSRLSPDGRPGQPVQEPTVSKGVATTTHPNTSEEDNYYYYYYGDEDYYYYDDYGNLAGKDGGGRRTPSSRPAGPIYTSTTTTTRPITKRPITLPPSFFGLPPARSRAARPKPEDVEAFTLLPPPAASVPLLPHHQPDAATPHLDSQHSSEETAAPHSGPITPAPEQHPPPGDEAATAAPRHRAFPSHHFFNPAINLGTFVGNGRHATVQASPEDLVDHPHILLALAGDSHTRRGGPVYFPAERGGLRDYAKQNYDGYTPFQTQRRVLPALQQPSESKHQSVTTHRDTRPPSPPTSVSPSHTPPAPKKHQLVDIVDDDVLESLATTTHSRRQAEETRGERVEEEQSAEEGKDEEGVDVEQNEDKRQEEEEKHGDTHEEEEENGRDGGVKHEHHHHDNNNNKHKDAETRHHMDGEERKNKGTYEAAEWRGEREKRGKLWRPEHQPSPLPGTREEAWPATKENEEEEEEEEEKKAIGTILINKPLFFSRLPLIGLTGHRVLSDDPPASLPSPSPPPQR